MHEVLGKTELLPAGLRAGQGGGQAAEAAHHGPHGGHGWDRHGPDGGHGGPHHGPDGGHGGGRGADRARECVHSVEPVQ